jgi:hypothetical protein
VGDVGHVEIPLLDAEEVSGRWAIGELESLLTAWADRYKARRNTRKLLNPCHVGFCIRGELIIRCRIFDAGFIPARERFEHRLTAIEQLNIPAWEAGKRSAAACVASTDLNFSKAREDIEVADMNPS